MSSNVARRTRKCDEFMGGNLEFIEGNSKSKFGAFLRQNTKSAHRRACRSILFDFEFDFRYRLCSPELEMKTYVCTLVLPDGNRSEEHTSELQSHSFISYAVFCLKKKKK